MVSNTSEYNGNLFDQLTILERIEKAADRGGEEEVRETIEEIRREVNRKLYQQPPLSAEN